MDIRKQMDDIYRNLPLEKIPWNLADPPELLVKAVECGDIKPCKTADLGCGVGNYSIWLARHGFDVTGFDISYEAIRHAKNRADEAGIKCEFVSCDLLADLTEFYSTFEFGLDWELLHHIFPDDRPQYVKNVHSILKPSGIYFSLCFSEQDPAFGGSGKFRETPIGTVLYFSSQEELKELFEPYFKVLELNTIEIRGKHGSHMAIASHLKRR